MESTTTEAVAARRIDELPTAFEGAARLVRAGLGIRAFGVQIFELPPNREGLGEHDETATGQEELYAALRGSGAIVVEGERHPLDAEHLVRVAPKARRSISTGPEGLRVLCVGGVPGSAYEPAEWTEAA